MAEQGANTVRYIREGANASRARRGEEPITDRELADLLLGTRYSPAAEALLAKMYADEDRGKP